MSADTKLAGGVSGTRRATNAGRPDLDLLIDDRSVEPGEPIFRLRARDPAAEIITRDWSKVAKDLGVPICMVELALQRADEMRDWPVKQLPAADKIDPERAQQLEYEHSRRAWNARDRLGDVYDSEAVLLAYRLGRDSMLGEIRARGLAA